MNIITLTAFTSQDIPGGLSFDANGDLVGESYIYLGGSSTGFNVIEIPRTSIGYGSVVTLAHLSGIVADGTAADSSGDLFVAAPQAGVGLGAIYEFASTPSGYGATPQTLVTFGNTGTYPVGGPEGNLVLDAAGNFYGITQNGGTGGHGVFYEIAKSGSGYAGTATVLASLDVPGQTAVGNLLMNGEGDLISSVGMLGGNPGGTILELAKTSQGYASTATILATFGSGTSLSPHLTLDSQGDIFGTLLTGGANGKGEIFELVKTASGYAATPTVVATFDATIGEPEGNLLVDSEGDLFGTSFATTSPGNGSVLYEVAKTASGYGSIVILTSFGSGNEAGVFGADEAGNLFGTSAPLSTITSENLVELTGAGFTVSASSAVAALQEGEVLAAVTVADSAAGVGASLDGLESLAKTGKLGSVSLTDSGVLSVTAAQLTSDASVLSEISGSFSLSIAAPASNATIQGLAGHPTTVEFSGDASQYAISSSGSVLSIAGAGGTVQLEGVNAIAFADHTDIVASQTPAVAGAVSTTQITELYGAVFGRTPDLGGLVFYQTYAAANPAAPFAQYAQWFLLSQEYTGNAAHNYAQTPAGDQQFISDSYQNLLHRAPSAEEVSFYMTNVINPALANLAPGTAAYAAADLLAHAQTLIYFSQSPEFLGDVQVTAQNPTSAQHWLVLV